MNREEAKAREEKLLNRLAQYGTVSTDWWPEFSRSRRYWGKSSGYLVKAPRLARKQRQQRSAEKAHAVRVERMKKS